MHCFPGTGSETRPKICVDKPAANLRALGMAIASNVASGRSFPFPKHNESITSLVRLVKASASALSAAALFTGCNRQSDSLNALAAASMAACAVSEEASK
ncbi:hypothetical protein ACPOL_6455 [Acidisarcina polymorpha]|uniref:Uncharacterized protein n=1 Tax=Acidisarcina polymorpha TaxID=2211140 RepID=A0A2Z5G964_9BACT|nr:hypothetical protein ACPOL_6455 [Acidisarcina polymorpha]